MGQVPVSLGMVRLAYAILWVVVVQGGETMYKFLLVFSCAYVVACTPVPPPVSEGKPASPAYRDEVLTRLSSIEKKVVELADVIPSMNYTWRPADDIRSVSEVCLHIAAANYGLPNYFGTSPPEGFSFDGYDTRITDKAEILLDVKESFVHLRNAIEKIGTGQSEEDVKMFGQDMTMRQAIWVTMEHLSEHLGQLIAYARVNGVTPPWSRVSQ